jgi:Tape measure protein
MEEGELMSSIDTRIVSMQFDNGAFEKRMADTMRSLDGLKKSLEFSSSKKSMDDLSTAGKNFTLGTMPTTIEGISTKFLAMATIGITALSQITARAIQTGAQLLSSLTIQPVKMGYQEYETNMNAIQTILANTAREGTNLKQVNAALDELNTYADLTIYDFAEMAKNIGTFTAAGVHLDTAVSSIKGLGNLAAVSGSSADQAATAMYQLSQAIAAGSVKLMDWNSVVNAGMGGETFQRALFDTGKALKAIPGVPMSQTFEQWTAGGNSFRESLQSGWLTSKVLTTALAAIAGDLNQAQMVAMGFTQQQAAELTNLGKIGLDAATKIKTFSQLMTTVKESIQSGWAMTFRIIIGDFQESKDLFTEIYNSLSTVISRSADARNAVLKGWKDLGGRTLLFQGIKDAIASLGTILLPIREAFRDFFPKKTAQDLYAMTQSFAALAKNLAVSGSTAWKISTIFKGFFSIVNIGIEIIKSIGLFLRGVAINFTGLGTSLSDFLVKVSLAIIQVQNKLVAGGAIQSFFIDLGRSVSKAIEYIKEFISNVAGFFGAFKDSGAVEGSVDKISKRFSGLEGIGQRISSVFQGIANIIGRVWDYVSGVLSGLADRMAQAMSENNFNAALDLLNVGLLTAVAVTLRKFMKQGLKLDVGGGLINSIKGSFDALTGTLKAMQAQIKAETLMKIAIAVGVLTVSIVALSLIDSAALTKALTAIAVGFGELISVMLLLDKSAIGVKSSAKMGIIAGAMILMSGAMVILSVAVKNLSSLSWGEIAKGLTAVVTLLAMMTQAINSISADTAGLVRAGASMILIAIALNILALAVKQFANMSWSEMLKGLVGIGVGLGIIVTAMNLMPIGGMAAAGFGIMEVATALNILALAVKAFGAMSWAEMGKGLMGVAGGLLAIVVGMTLMPGNLAFTAGGVLILSVALNIMAKAVASMGSIAIGQIGKGIGAFAAMLIVLAIGVNAMNGAVTGATSLLMVSAALVTLATAMKILAGMSIAQLATSLGAIAAALIILGVAGKLITSSVPGLIGLGVALDLIAASFLIFGAGAFLFAESFQIMAKAGQAGTAALIKSIQMFLAALPNFVTTFVIAFGQMLVQLQKVVPKLITLIGTIIEQMALKVIELTPVILLAFGTMLSAFLLLIQQKVPEFVTTGFAILTAFMQGLSDNIVNLTNLAVSIVIQFAKTLTDNAQKIVDAAVNLLIAFTTALANRAGDIVTAGANLLVQFLYGIAANLGQIVGAVFNIITTFVTEVGKGASRVVTAGANAIINFVTGLGQNADKIVNKGVEALVNFLNGLNARDNVVKIGNAAFQVVIGFLNGVTEVLNTNMSQFIQAGKDMVGAVLNGMGQAIATNPIDLGMNFVKGFKTGLSQGALSFLGAVLKDPPPARAGMYLGESMVKGLALSIDSDTSTEKSINSLMERVNEAFKNFTDVIPQMEEFNPTITPVLDLTNVETAAASINKMIVPPTITPNLSLDQARLISTTAQVGAAATAVAVPTGPSTVSFEQNIYSPTALSTNDIYKGTKSQIARAKEELSI